MTQYPSTSNGLAVISTHPDLTSPRFVLLSLYIEKALEQLQSDGYEVRPEDVARLSPLPTHHVNVLGRYSFSLAEQVANSGMRPLRSSDDEDGWPLA
jgi:hypothetical protein